MITIYVSDFSRALDFYIRKLGVTQTADFRDNDRQILWVIPSPAGEVDPATEIALYAPEETDPGVGTSSGIVFSPRNIERTYRELKADGVGFTLDLVRHTYGEGEGNQEARFVDLDGNEFLLRTWVRPNIRCSGRGCATVCRGPKPGLI